MTPNEAPVFDVVRLRFLDHPWYARATFSDGRTLHSEPWRGQWAATRCAELLQRRWYSAMSRRGELGDGDTCPLDAGHGNMYSLPYKVGEVPRQYCGHVAHDGGGPRVNGQAPPRSRSMWPLHGFHEAVALHFALLARDIHAADLPDLTDMEVH